VLGTCLKVIWTVWRSAGRHQAGPSTPWTAWLVGLSFYRAILSLASLLYQFVGRSSRKLFNMQLMLREHALHSG